MQTIRAVNAVWRLLAANSGGAARNYSQVKLQSNSFGLLFDIDGVLLRGRTPIPAAQKIFKKLVDRDGRYKVPVVFVTNAGNCMRQDKARQLASLLEVEVSPEQVMLSHSPLRMFSDLHKMCVLASGQGPIVEMAHKYPVLSRVQALMPVEVDLSILNLSLGFRDVVTVDMLREAYPLLDIVDHDRRPTGDIPLTKGLRPIEAVILFGEPIRWETNLQLIIDVLLTRGNPGSPWNPTQYPHIPVLACNMDLLWMAEANNPRFGHGMFLVCLESLYKKITGYDLKYEALIGKPSVVTYNYAELLIRQQAESLGWTKTARRLYAIGDNPMADIYGANLYNRYLQACRQSKAHVQAKGSGGVELKAEMIARPPKMTSTELGGVLDTYGTDDDLPEGCSSILVCTGVYSREEEELPQDSTQTVTEQRIFHGHRDFRFDPTLTQPSFVVHDVKEAVERVFQMEGWSLD